MEALRSWRGGGVRPRRAAVAARSGAAPALLLKLSNCVLWVGSGLRRLTAEGTGVAGVVCGVEAGRVMCRRLLWGCRLLLNRRCLPLLRRRS